MHVHRRPHHGGRSWRPHQFTTIANMKNVIEVFLKKLTTSIVVFVLNTFLYVF